MTDDFVCRSVQAGLSQYKQISEGKCKSVVLSIMVGIHTPLVVKAFITFIVTIMIKDIALSSFTTQLLKCKGFNQGNILFQQGKITCAGCLRDIWIVCNVALSQELFEDDFSLTFLNRWLCSFSEDDLVDWKTPNFQVYNTASSSGSRKDMSFCPYSSEGKRHNSLPVGVTAYLTVTSHRGVWLLVAPPVDRENSEGFLRGLFNSHSEVFTPFWSLSTDCARDLGSVSNVHQMQTDSWPPQHIPECLL